MHFIKYHRTFSGIQSTFDYYPFGMGMPGRGYSGSGYDFGFNGKENDNEVYGDGNFQDYGMRMYDTRVGRFASVDPLRNEYPWYTPYQFAGNTPIQAIDRDGEEELYINDNLSKAQWSILSLRVALNTTTGKEMVGALKKQTQFDVVFYLYSQLTNVGTNDGNTNIGSNLDEERSSAYSYFVDTDIAEKTFKSGKELINIGIDDSYEYSIDRVNTPEDEQYYFREMAWTWIHEIGAHVIDALKGKHLPQNEQHYNFQGEKGNETSGAEDIQYNPDFCGTPGNKALEEIDSMIEINKDSYTKQND